MAQLLPFPPNMGTLLNVWLAKTLGLDPLAPGGYARVGNCDEHEPGACSGYIAAMRPGRSKYYVVHVRVPFISSVGELKAFVERLRAGLDEIDAASEEKAVV